MKRSIHNLCKLALKQLVLEGYTEKGINKHNKSYKLIMKYAEENGLNI